MPSIAVPDLISSASNTDKTAAAIPIAAATALKAKLSIPLRAVSFGAAPRISSSVETPRSSAKRGRELTSGQDKPVSHT